MVWTFSIETFYPRSEEHRLPEAVARWTATTGILPANGATAHGRERQIAERSRSFCHRSRWAVQRSPGDAATPSRSIADQATQRRYRQHFLGRDPVRTWASPKSSRSDRKDRTFELRRSLLAAEKNPLRPTLPNLWIAPSMKHGEYDKNVAGMFKRLRRHISLEPRV